MESRKEQLIKFARAAQRAGFVPIPVKGKVPRIRNWPNIRYDPKDPEKNIRRIEHFYDQGLANNIAAVTGEASGIVVIDVETSALPWWEDLVKRNGGLPETFTVQTGTGGLHIYFKYTPSVAHFGNMNKILGRDIDFRTNRGNILLPGSIDSRTGQMYMVISGYENNEVKLAEMPDWLIQLLEMHANRDKIRAISIDIDGTIANIDERLRQAQSKYAYGTGAFWNYFLSGSLFYLDRPIPQARDFLQRFAQCGRIIYLSGRPLNTFEETQEWLRSNGFPNGELLLRPSGNTREFKTNQLIRLKREYYLIAHIGDSEDDRLSAQEAGVPFVQVKTNEWLPHDPVTIC